MGSVNKTVTKGVKKARRNPFEITKHSFVDKVASIGLFTRCESPSGAVENVTKSRNPFDYNKFATSTTGGSSGLKKANEVACETSFESSKDPHATYSRGKGNSDNKSVGTIGHV